MATGETFKASMIGELADGTAVVFNFGYWDNASGSVHFDTGIGAGDFQTLIQTTMQNALPDDYTIRRYRFACVAGVHAGEIGYVEELTGLQGNLSAVNRSPNEMCASLKRSTGWASRRDRGRIYFGPLAVDLHDNSNINKVDIAGPLADVADLMKANLTTGGFALKPVILSAVGTHTGRIVSRVAVHNVMVHHKSRRPRTGA